MQSYFLSDTVVQAYLRDLAARLRKLPDNLRPRVWCPLGPSGLMVAQQLLDIADSPTEILTVVWERETNEARFHEPEGAEAVKGIPTLVLDTAVHRGATMEAALRLIQASGSASITSFALVVRCSARVIPNFFSLLINDTDRAWLPTEQLPNQRLTPTGVFRRLAERDMSHPMIETGAEFIDRGCWTDHWYDQAVDPNRHVYVVEDQGRPIGYVSFTIQGYVLRIDEVAVDWTAQGRGFGAYLIRWAENLARHRGCRESTLWSIENRVQYYQRFEYKLTGDNLPLGKDGQFFRMRKGILYNLLVSPG